MVRARTYRPVLVAVGLAAGASAGAVVVGLAGAGASSRVSDSPAPFIEATHLPPLLTAMGEQTDLRYDVYCSPVDADEISRDCDAMGTVFIRPGNSGAYEEVPLALDPAAAEGRYVAPVPAAIAASRDGFSYYATIRSASTGATTTLPSGGTYSPQRSVPLGRSVDVLLGSHAFGDTSSADSRVAAAAWGDGADEVGLEPGRNLTPTGGSSFDVDPTGTVTVLDEAHRRLLRWTRASATPTRVPVAVNGTLADMTVADDGSTYVLESTAGPGRALLVREFGRDGMPRRVAAIAERRASQIRMGPSGPFAYQQPASEWMPVIDDEGVVEPESQRRRGRVGRPLPSGGEVIALRTGNEVRAAIVGPSGVRRSWRITSDTPVAEIQLAEPLGGRLILVLRVYTDSRSEFVALVLGQRGVLRSLSLASDDWAETAPLSRFRLAGSSLYRLGSSARGIFVDRYDLEVS